MTEQSARVEVVDFVRRELIGPAGGDDELLGDPPHRRYLMGTLYPRETTTAELEDIEPQDEADGSLGDELADDPVTLAHEWMPSSIGVSFYVSAGATLACEVWGAHYVIELEGRSKRWRRSPLSDGQRPERIELLEPDARRRAKPVPVLDGRAVVESFWRPLGEGRLVTVTLMSTAVGDPADIDTERTLHQVGFRCSSAGAQIREYPHVNALSTDEEDAELRVLYRHAKVFAVGHGCSAVWDTNATHAVDSVTAEFMPSFQVPGLTQDVAESEAEVLRLSFLSDESQGIDVLAEALETFVDEYEQWIGALPEQNPDIPSSARAVAAQERILDRLSAAAERMRKGITFLREDPVALRSFRLANLAMLMQMRHAKDDLAGTRRDRGDRAVYSGDYRKEDEYRWYPFQLAFQLLALESTANADSSDRGLVDLLWFPTGGGKTEAYLALTAFIIFLRRLRHQDRGGGTVAITRYTLRLLTAQQFQRAAALICACELIRADHEEEMGSERLTIGLWVGADVAPNTYEKAVGLYEETLDEAEPRNRFQLEQCPWCGTALVPGRRDEDRGAYGFVATDTSFRFYCPSDSCIFHERLPVAVVDDALYDRPPTLLIATVDKFARVAWLEKSGVFFGDDHHAAPSLIIQDELHLLSGPLGTTVGLYESAIEALIEYNGEPPKVIASTATIRRADEQSVALFGRRVRLFPPSGLDARDSFFARIDRTRPGRLYVGVMAPGHTVSTAVIHTAAALLQAPLELNLDGSERDAYATLVAYHNSLRELGRTVTLARDDIPARIKFIASDETNMRALGDDDVVELTSNVSGAELPSLLNRMFIPAFKPDGISLLATTNMLSVGVDVRRLGLMLMNGQPKTTSEYIQATSRVGRGDVPGLIVGLFTSTKARDRSHYETFLPYHAALYRHVEPTSVTPFSPPARERALHAALVILIRHGAGLAADDDAGRMERTSEEVRRAVATLVQRVTVVDPDETSATGRQLERLLDEWEERAEEARGRGQSLYYKPQGKQYLSLLRDFGASGSGWETLHSMRNVDVQCNVEVLGAQ